MTTVSYNLQLLAFVVHTTVERVERLASLNQSFDPSSLQILLQIYQHKQRAAARGQILQVLLLESCQ